MFGWRAVFFVNAPFGVVAIVAGRLLIPESRARRPRRLDPVGQVIMVMFIVPLTYAVIEGSAVGWTDPVILRGFVAAAIGLAGFIVVERRSREPMLDLRYLALPGFRPANLVVLLAFAVMAGFLFMISLYLQQERQLAPAAAAMALLPLPGGIALFAPLAGRVGGPTRPSRPDARCRTLHRHWRSATHPACRIHPLSATLGGALLLVGAGLGLMNPPRPSRSSLRGGRHGPTAR
jgi:MFS family permease